MMEKATFAAGCFWGVEARFAAVDGVFRTAVGYMGGKLENPTYEQVCTGTTGHAEVIQLEFDPTQVSYEELLEVLWKCHDPTTLNRQGPDVGTQYRSAIFYHSDEQKEIAVKSKQNLDENGPWGNPATTQIVPATTMTMAEDYHQQYLAKRGMQHCHF